MSQNPFHFISSVGLCLVVFGIQTALAADGAREESSTEPVSRLNRMVVTSHQVPVQEKFIGGAVTVIERETIEASAQTHVIEALRGVAGVDIVRSGGAGGAVSTFMRGANSEHTLILIDGIEATNPATPGGAFDLANLTIDAVERIEILRGPQSLMYGSNAMGGVINIITRKGAQDKQLTVTTSGGSYSTGQVATTLSVGDRNDFLTVSASGQTSGSISSADRSLGNKEDDPYENGSLTVAGGVNLGRTKLSTTLRKVTSNAEIDDGGGVGGDDPNRQLDNDVLLASLRADTEIIEGLLSQQAQFEYTEHDLEDNDDPDSVEPLELLRSGFRGYRKRYSLIETVTPLSWLAGSVGGEYEEDRANSNYLSVGQFGEFSQELEPVGMYNKGIYGELRLLPESVGMLSAGVRHDENSRFGSQDTWRITASKPLPWLDSRLHASGGTGFKAPTVTQLFSPFGNTSLEAETSQGWDVGYEFMIPQTSVRADATFFWNDFRNLIQFDQQTFALENIDRAKSRGLEMNFTAPFGESLTWQGSFTYLDTTNLTTQESLLRRARTKARSVLTYRPCDVFRISSDILWVGPRYDRDFSGGMPQNVKLGSYVIFGLNGVYDVTETAALTFRLENLFDKEYQEVSGFGAPGTSALVGLKLATDLFS
jgi:vitamin B12 transporter